jgi:HEAT repeat protein
VRAAAAEALGQFVLNGELGELEESIANEAEESLITILVSGSEPLDVQRRALESLAYSSRDEVAKQIRRAHSSNIIEMQASAIFAMGRTADNIWDEDVLEALGEDSEAPLLYEAAKAAGELLLLSSVDRLIDLMLIDDREIRDAAIWSLGEIGGRTAQNALMNLVQTTEDEDLIEALEDAFANAQLIEGDFSMFALDSEPDDFEE